MERFETFLQAKERPRKEKPAQPEPKTTVPILENVPHHFGDKGSNWRMMKLKRVYEIAKEEKRPVEEVALERYGDLQVFEEAVRERQFLDEQQKKSGASSKFRRPQSSEQQDAKDPQSQRVPSVAPSQSDSRSQSQSKSQSDSRSHTVRKIEIVDGQRVLSQNELNQLNAQVLKAKLMKAPNLKELQEKYELELERAQLASSVEGLQKAEQPKQETKEDLSLEEMVKEEKRDSGKRYDGHMAESIKRRGFSGMEDLGEPKKARTFDTSKMDVRNRNREQEALNECPYCFKDGYPPKATLVSLGIKTYLALPLTIEMVPFHCYIVPVQHVTTTLELEDDAWDEIRNFQKTLLQMMDQQDKRVIFMETVINRDWHKHTVIECIPVPLDFYEDAPAYYKEALLQVEEEWSQHKKVISTTERGFRRSLVPQLPYFHVWFDPDRGYGHVIEDPDSWEPWFGKQIIANVLDLSPEFWRRPRRAMLKDIQVDRFKKHWDAFDWTKMLE
ncbi:CwfJ C-terminus 1-domain-containing protein-like protein [Gorgonomyces haynaldii]|nr:CwfJ C-terminus 1-domain-containing protein-like protein [Gorgonomyces haynaldii]